MDSRHSILNSKKAAQSRSIPQSILTSILLAKSFGQKGLKIVASLVDKTLRYPVDLLRGRKNPREFIGQICKYLVLFKIIFENMLYILNFSVSHRIW